MKNIIYTGAFRFPIGDAAAARVLNNAKIFRELGHSVIFLSWGGIYRESDKKEDGHYYYHGFRYIISRDIDIKEKGLKKIIFFLLSGQNAIKIILQIIPNADVIVGYDHSLYFSYRIMKLSKKYKIPYVSDITEWYSANEYKLAIFSPLYLINNFNMYYVKKLVKNKIVISSYLYRFYNKTNNIIIPPLIDNQEAKWIELKSVLPRFEGIRIIYAGTPGKKDLLETILEAVLLCVNEGFNLQFIILGVTKEYISKFKNYAAFISFPRNFFFLGLVSQTEVPSYYAVSDFSILLREPTRKSMAGFPTKIVESMASGCPVILNYTSDLENYIFDKHNGFVVPDSSLLELKKVLNVIMKLTSEEIKQLKINSFKCASENFNYLTYVDKMANFIDKII